MSFQMIPPRVPSSPPPLDSVTGEEDDFGDFIQNNSTFDITGNMIFRFFS